MMFNTAAVTIEKTVWRIIILFICARTTFGDSYFRIHFQSFGNTRNLMRTPSDNITCCRTQCLLPCSGYLTVSLSGAFGEITRDCFRIGTSSTISFGDRVGNANNPVVFRFQAPDLSKNISLSIKIRSDHDSNFTIYRHKFSFMLLVLGNIRSPTSFSSRDASTNSSLNFSVDFVNCKGNKSLHLFCNDKGERVCEKNYYGEHCREHCIVTTITRGHCNQLGKLVCENGWTGSDCSISPSTKENPPPRNSQTIPSRKATISTDISTTTSNIIYSLSPSLSVSSSTRTPASITEEKADSSTFGIRTDVFSGFTQTKNYISKFVTSATKIVQRELTSNSIDTTRTSTSSRPPSSTSSSGDISPEMLHSRATGNNSLITLSSLPRTIFFPTESITSATKIAKELTTNRVSSPIRQMRTFTSNLKSSPSRPMRKSTSNLKSSPSRPMRKSTSNLKSSPSRPMRKSTSNLKSATGNTQDVSAEQMFSTTAGSRLILSTVNNEATEHVKITPTLHSTTRESTQQSSMLTQTSTEIDKTTPILGCSCSKIRIELTYRNLTHTPFPVLHLLLNIQNFLRDTICSETNVIDVDECLDKSADNRTLYIQAKCGDRCVTDHEIYSQLNSLTDENFKHRFPILQRTTPRSPSAKDEDSNWFSVHWQWMLGASLCLFVIILGCIIIMHHRQRKSEIQGRDSSEEDIREMSTFDPYLNPIYSLND
ncbi:serine-rich adhesin for platelets-like isoform X1 [Ostrea edulis]|uniref:serine-rich adhesin for platelets-like isoform X1 n=1 Tax=Ostrea edulis TaxID=37623 RepID=UPI0024AF76B1|nr:serine-rich adhesin for platelets-like isoform X1 [Ostrea edulis]